MQLQMLHEWVQLAPVAMALISYPEGLVLAGNMQIAELLDWPQKQMYGRTTRELGLVLDTQQRENIIRRVRGQSEPITVDLQLSSRSGEILDVQIWLRYTRLHEQELLLLQQR